VRGLCVVVGWAIAKGAGWWVGRVVVVVVVVVVV
jgi:hypothetical protein